MKQSNRIVVQLNDDMEISYESGIQTVYLNSYLANEFVVRPSFQLAPSETMWVTFSQTGATPLNAIMLAQRQSTQANSTKQVVTDDTQTDIEQTDETVYEYYAQLPQAVADNVGQWGFSLDIRVIPNTAQPTNFTTVWTSDKGSFVVNDSLSNVQGGAPNDQTIASLYNTAVNSAAEAKTAAETATQAAQQATDTVSGAIEQITQKATQQATEQATNATKQAVVAETNRAQTAEANLAQSQQKIESYIPTDASSTNKLASQEFVNSSINNMAAFYITYNAQGDAFPTRESLLTATTYYYGGQPRVPTQNDYAIVLHDESQPLSADGQYPTTRYIYNGEQWAFQYVVNNTSLTQEQVNALNSGITSELVEKIDDIVGVASTTISYAVGESGTVAPTTGWQDTIPAVPQAQYLWTRTVTVYTDQSIKTAYSVARQGENGGLNPATMAELKAYIDNALKTGITDILNTPI